LAVDVFGKIAEKFEHDPLGGAYYAIAILTALGSGLVWLFTKLDRLDILGYTVAALMFLVAIGLLLVPRLRRDKPTFINARLGFDDNTYEIDVRPDSLQIRRRHRLKALEEVDRYVFVLRPTGNPTHELQLTSAGTLKGPLEKRDRVTYEVEFPVPLKTGETYDLSFEVRLNDPERTMKRFFSIGGLGGRRMGPSRVTIRFPSDRPQSVCHEVVAVTTGSTLQAIRDLLPNSSGEYGFKLNAVKSTESHVVSWAWNA
jgi:hypothetical protein